MLRTTSGMMRDRWLDDTQVRLNRLDSYNKQIGTGKKISGPADDPTGTNRLMRLNEVVARNDQYLSNIDEAIHLNSTTESVLDQVYERLARAKSLAVEASNEASLSTRGALSAYGEEVKGIKDGVVDLAQTQVEGKYIFNGTAGETSPYRNSGGPYMGDDNVIRVNLGNGQTVPLNLTGDRAFRETAVSGKVELFSAQNPTFTVDPANPLTFQVTDGLGVATTITLSGNYTAASLPAAINTAFTASGANLSASVVNNKLTISIADDNLGGEMTFATVTGDLDQTLGITTGTKNVFGLLDDLAAAMDAGSTQGVSEILDRIDALTDNVANMRGQHGSRARNLEFARERLVEYNLTSETLKENIEGIDLPETIMRMTAQEQAYEAALASGSRIFNISILNYLR